jgi:hypothetical protein
MWIIFLITFDIGQSTHYPTNKSSYNLSHPHYFYNQQEDPTNNAINKSLLSRGINLRDTPHRAYGDLHWMLFHLSAPKVHINVEWIKQKTPRMWGLMLICFYGLKIGATYLPLISFFPKKCYNISCLILGYRRAFRNRILLSLSIINRLRLRPHLPCLVFVIILIPILLLNNNHLDVVPL